VGGNAQIAGVKVRRRVFGDLPLPLTMLRPSESRRAGI
jgi:hypothetical protein